VKLGAELREEAMEEDWTRGSGCGGGGAEGACCGSGAAGDSLGGLATRSGAGGATGSLSRVRVTNSLITRK
jgi:hypothetical protein